MELLKSQKQEVTGPVCRRFFYFFRFIGTLIIVGTLVADFAYCTKQTFSSKELLVGCVGVLGLRIAATIITIFSKVCGKVCDKE